MGSTDVGLWFVGKHFTPEIKIGDTFAFFNTFDVVDHDIMARKLEIYGFNEKAFAVFNSYMTNRTQQVQIGNALSNKCLHLVLLQYISLLLSLHHNSILFKSSWTLVCIAEIFSHKCVL
jgi:hypothetical protein